MEPHSARESVFGKRKQAAGPVSSFTAETVRDGSFTEGYEEYLADQFPVRDGWISLKTRTELLSSRREINNVFIGKGNWLIDKYDGTLSQERIDGNLKLLGDFTTYAVQTLGQDHVRVLLVPTASAVLTDKLPPFAHDFDQQALLDEAASLCPEGTALNLLPLLQEKQSEYLYYRTDHHWTTLGAYYGYSAWAESIGLTPWSRDSFTEETVTESFYGTTYSKINLPVTPDSIVRFTPKEDVLLPHDNQPRRKGERFPLCTGISGKEGQVLLFPQGGNNPIVEITSYCRRTGTQTSDCEGFLFPLLCTLCRQPFRNDHTFRPALFQTWACGSIWRKTALRMSSSCTARQTLPDDRYLSTLSR